MKQRFMNYAGGFGSILIGKFCPVCYSVISVFLTSIGAGFIIKSAVLKGLLILFLVIGVFGLWRSRKVHRDPWPIRIALISSVVLYAGRYNLQEDILFYIGAVGLILAMVWDIKKRADKKDSCPMCQTSVERR